MTEKLKDGGMAFPLGANEYAGHGPCWGMSLRDYFIAHAPHEPQPWFAPAMDDPRPPVPRIEDAPEHLRAQVRAELMDDYNVIVGAEAEAWVLQRRAAVHAWEAEREKRRYVRWPAAWADAQLAAREKQS
jgi:hypothetical protein